MRKVMDIIKYCLVQVAMNFLKIFWIFSVKKNNILFISFNGMQFSDSPKYIYEYLKKENNLLEYVWAFEKPENYPYIHDKKVNSHSGSFFIAFSKAHVIVTNNYLPSYIPVKKKQIVLNTWHGGGALKKCGLAEEGVSLYDKLFFSLHSKKYTAFLSGSKITTQKLYRESFGFDGEILEYGLPRNSIFFTDHSYLREKVLSYFQVNRKSVKIILYAPTYRGNASKGGFLEADKQLDYDKCIELFRKIYNEEVMFLFRAHPAVKVRISNEKVIDVSGYDDMQELLCASDILITDYSSCMYDMALMRKPVFLYVPDVNHYIDVRGFYYDFYRLPFTRAMTYQELEYNIEKFNLIEYRNKVEQYLQEIGCVESGDATKRSCNWLCSKL